MLKRIFLALLVATLISVSAVAVDIEFDVDDLYQDQDTNYVPMAGYTLSDNSSYDGMNSIQSGWTYDGRGDLLREEANSGTYGVIRDISTTNGSCLYRDLNKVSDGKLFVETGVKINNGFDGLEIFFNDENGERAYSLKTEENAIWIMDGDGNYEKYKTAENLATANSFKIKIYVDFAELEAVTVIDDARAATTSLASDNFMRFGFATTNEDVLSIAPSSVKITANYLVDDDFKLYGVKDVKSLPYGWTNRDNLNDAYIANKQAYVKGGSYLAKAFTSVVNAGVLATDFQMFANPGATGEVALTSLEGEKVVFSFDGTNFKLGDTVVYENYLEELWYRVRVEADLDNSTAKVYINGRVEAEDIAITGVTKLNSIKFTATGDGIEFDNVLVQSLVEADNYVPTPVKPADSNNNIVGVNVCSLWSYESNHGWGPISPYDDFKPILGYYDEGSREVADWEIKMMVEHGIDFQAFCWFADQKDAPLKYQSHTLQLHEGYMYAKYADMMNYCLLWEASNGAVPASVDAFKNYYVPYWIEHYFKDPRYLVIDNQPVLMAFGYGNFIKSVGGNEAAAECMDYLREELKALGFDGLIVILSNAEDGAWVAASGANAVCRYNWGTNGKDLDYTINQIKSSAEKSKREGYTWTVPTLSTGFNSLPWAGERHGNMTPEDFKSGLEYMKNDYFTAYPAEETWQDKLYILSTWNEYGEGTFMMPSKELHGFGYLEAVREVMTDNNGTHTDVLDLEADQLARIGKNYPQYVRVLKRNDTYAPDVEKTLAAVAETVFEGYETFKVGACESVSYEDGISAIAKDGTSYVETADVLGVEIAESAALSVEMTVDEATTVNVWYTTEDSQYYTDDKVLTFEAVPGTTTYTVDFVQKDMTLRSLRIMPTTKNSVYFTINKVSILNPLRLFIDEKCLESKVFPENIDGTVYYPFDPTLAQGYIMNCHFTWDAATKVLTIIADNGKWIEYTVGSDVALTDSGNVDLPYEVYLSDNLPMLHMETLCDVIGFDYEESSRGLKISTNRYEQNSATFTRPENEWMFANSGSNLGWSPDNVVFDTADDNSLHITAYQNDPRAYASKVNFIAAKYKAIEVELKYESERVENLSFFFTTDMDKTWNEAKHLMQLLPSESSEGEYVTVVFDLYDKTNYAPSTWTSLENVNITWADNITGLRLDAGDYADFECWIKSIKLIPDEDYVEESTAIVKTEFASVTFDAEDDVVPFDGGEEAEITVVADPMNAENKVYMVAPKAGYETGNYLSLYYDMKYEPGATYTVTFKYLPAIDGKSIAADFIFVDPSRAGQSNPDDHFTSNTNMSASEWKEYTSAVTVGSNCFDRTNDQFRIYTDPLFKFENWQFVRDSVGFYVDDIVITKTTSAAIKDDSVQISKDDSGKVTVSGSTEAILPGEKSVVVALYEGNRLLGMKVVHLNESTKFVCDFANAAGATKAKVFMWKGMRTFAPQSAFVEVVVQ